MTLILPGPLPQEALLQRYQTEPGCYTDCFQCTVRRPISLPAFVEAFYTAPLFRAERLVLKYGLKRPSTDAQAHAMAYGEITRFAAWDLEDRSETQLLMCDMHQATRSWFMTETLDRGATLLRFGSAVMPKAGTNGLPLPLKVLIPLHRLYARLLLRGAVNRVLTTA